MRLEALSGPLKGQTWEFPVPLPEFVLIAAGPLPDQKRYRYRYCKGQLHYDGVEVVRKPRKRRKP